MAINKKFLTLPKVAGTSTTSELVDIFGDGTGRRLYNFSRDNSETGGNANYAEVNVDNGRDGKLDWGVYFDGTNLSGGSGGSYIDTTADLIPTSGSFTISLWLQPHTTFGYFLARGFVSEPLGGFAIYHYSDGATEGYHKIGVYRNVGSASASTAAATASFSDSNSTTAGYNIWYHYIISYDSSNNTVTIYRNGSAGTTVYIRASDNATGVFSSMNSGTIVYGISGSYDYPGRLRLGNRSNSQSGSTLSNSPYTGYMDQLRIINKAITSTEAATLYNEVEGTHTGTTNTHLFGCVANYNLDNSAKESLGTTAYDGTETNITYQLGKFGSAAKFGGSSNINTNIAASFFNTNNWTISLWYKKANNSGYEYFLGTTSLSPNISFGFAFGIYGDGSRFDFFTRGNGSTISRFQGGSARNNVWTHLVVISNSSTSQFTFYQDGALMNNYSGYSQPTTIGSYTNTGSNLTLGRAGAWTTEQFNGSLDQVRVWNTALTASNVTDLYAEKYAYITKNADQPFGDSSCKAYYKFENSPNDAIGSYNATNNNVTYTTTDPAFGSYAGVFNGTNAYYNLSTSLRDDLDNNFSVSLWMKTPSTALAQYTQYTHAAGYYYAGSGSAEGWLIYTYNYRIYFYWVSSFGVGNNIASSANLVTQLNQWFHVVITKTSSNAQIFIDGNKDIDTTSVSSNSMYFPNNAGVQIGCYYGPSYAGFSNHSYDQVRFFNRELTGIEVAQLHEEKVYG
jgi:hypothetical protein